MSQLAANLTSRLTDFELQRLQEIHETGYWRIRIRPTQFDKHLIPSLEQCRDILRVSAVSLRGWDYPSWLDEEVFNGRDWLQGGSGVAPYIEYWRFYQSGQFVHHFAMREDYQDPLLQPATRIPASHPKCLDISQTLFRITEIYEFAARLASRKILLPQAVISIQLLGTEGRRLQHRWNQLRPIGRYECRLPSIETETTCDALELLGNSAALALNATKAIFEGFNWIGIPEKILAEDQRKFLERRI